VIDSDAREERQWAVAIGVFDGVHRGHQDLIRQMLEGAHTRGCQTACVTFDPDPEVVVRPEAASLSLSSIDERIAWLRSLGVDHIEVIRFDQEVANLTPEAFIARLLEKFQVTSVWVGSEFRFGHDRAGHVETLKDIGVRCGFDVRAVEPLEYRGRRISASWIRAALAEGNMGLVQELLGRPYAMSGTVVEGMQRGRLLGFPTANVVPPTGRALPADGVYLVQATVAAEGVLEGPGEGPWHGVVNLGARPTFAEYERLLETHLLDFHGDLYGQTMRVQFLQQLRGIKKFESVDALREQIDRDIEAARRLAGRMEDPEIPTTRRP
jgi:riboflavin kinase / FMN adenylyltransferase